MNEVKLPELVRWTDASIYCYERNCICEGCVYKKKLETPCVMKRTVMALFEKFGKPEDKNAKTKKKQLFVTKYYGEDAQKLKLIREISSLKHEILSGGDGELFNIFARVLNTINGIILYEDMENQVREMQNIGLEKEINCIHQKNFKIRKSNKTC